jgi:hypothetical protein
MGEKALVENQIADAIKLIQKLDADARAPSLAAWYYYDDADEWRLLIAGSTFDALLPKQEAVAYKYLVETMASLSLSSLTISDLKLVGTKSSLPQALCVLIRTGPDGIVRARFTNTTLNGIFIKEMIILRST